MNCDRDSDHEGPMAKLPVPEDVQEAIRTLLRWSGDDPAREGLVDTPARVALDRGWIGVALGFKRAQQRLGKAKVGKIGHGKLSI
jgi:GTP cyclohydrolase I